jgi:hypothetical protein
MELIILHSKFLLDFAFILPYQYPAIPSSFSIMKDLNLKFTKTLTKEQNSPCGLAKREILKVNR